jgi:hypothetical protein
MSAQRISDKEFECVRALLGQQIVSVCFPTVTVYDGYVTALSASMRLEEERGFVVIHAVDIPTGTSEGYEYFRSRPAFRRSEIPNQIPFMQGKKSIVGPCSEFWLGAGFYVKRIDIFEIEQSMMLGGQTDMLTHDKQITFYASEGRQISVWSSDFELCFSYHMGLCADPSQGLRRRLSLD